jgi:hypothetical protein
MGAAVLLLVLGGVAACGDDDADTSSDTDGDTPARSETSDDLRQEYVDAIVAIADDEDDEAFPPEARLCVAESFVDAFGAEEMREAGVEPEDIAGDVGGPGELGLDFSDEQSAAFYDQMSGCMDLRSLIVEGVLGAESELPPEAVACLDENLTDDLLERFFVTGFTQGDAGFEDNPELEAEFNDAVTPCMELSGP